MVMKEIGVVPLRSERGSLRLQRLLLENPPVANHGYFKAINHILNRRQAHLGL
jgi:hypothetical protein